MMLGVGLGYIDVVFVRTLEPFGTGPGFPSSARALVPSISGFVGRSC